MEFERAIFRVYERCMDSILHEDDPANDVVYKKPCRMFELILAGLGIFLLFTLLLLHGVYVGNAGCLPQELMVFNSTTNTSSIRSFQDDEILLITIGNTMLRRSGSNLRIVDDDETNSNYERRRLQEYQFLDPSTTIQSLLSTYIYPLSNSSDHTFPSNITNHNNASTSSEVNKDWEYDYMVTFDYGVMLLDPDVKQSHHFTVVNVTLAGLECFGGETALNFLPLGGLDTAVLNNVMYSTNMSGQMISRRNDYYHWHTRDIYPNRNFGQWLGWKISIMLSSLFAFFLLSTTTALLVRVLISSGVVLVFPLFWCFQMFGMQAINLRLISLSYPWIGLPLQIIRARNQSMTPFIIAHLTRVVIYYLMYIGAQSLYIKLLYSDSTFGLDQIWLYAVMMLWEYYSMIYIRSSSSIMFFPKASLALFLIFHFYYYSFPAGFHLLALTVMFVFLMYLMIHCIRAFEIKAYRQGLVNIDQPR